MIDFISDPDYCELMKWSVFKSDTSNEFKVDLCRSNDEKLTSEKIKKLEGYVIILEGGIGQGKSTIIRELDQILKDFNIKCWIGPEPIDAESLRLFMKFGIAALPKKDDMSEFAEIKRNVAKQAAIRMQFTMMRKRMELAKEASRKAREGYCAILDRGPFGDAVFMQSTFSKFEVSTDISLQYMVEFQKLYLEVDFPPDNFIVVHLNATAQSTYKRWLERESSKTENKYDIQYVKMIENAHKICSSVWGPHITYNNNNVPLYDVMINQKIISRPSECAIKSLILTILDFIENHKININVN